MAGIRGTLGAAGRFLRLTSSAAGYVAATTATVAAAYLALLTVVGLARNRRAPGSDAADPTTRFTVLVPAHDEAAGIGETLRSLRALDYPADRVSLHVVADNCADDTAAVVRAAGVDVHERVDPAAPGKGPALNWLHDRLVVQGVAADTDAFVVIDADTTVERGFLRALDRAFDAGASVVQGQYSVRHPDASPTTSFRYAALACRHHLRPLGRRGIGGSCGLYGNGMGFRRDVLAGRRWSDHLVEDAELQLELLLDGVPVDYVPAAVVRAEMPADREQATSQQQRWEQGRIDLVRRFARPLAVRSIVGPERRAAADATVDLLLPPLSVLVVADLAITLTAVPFAIIRARPARCAAAAGLVGLGVIGLHTVAGLHAVGADRSHFLALRAAPSTVVWKARLWMSSATGRTETTWQRTRRNSEVVR